MPLLCNLRADRFGQMLRMAAGQVAFAIEKRKGALLAGECGAGAIGRLIDERHPTPALRPRLRRCHRQARTMASASARPVRPSPRRRLARASCACAGQGIIRDIDDIVHEAHRARNQIGKRRLVESRLCP